MYMSLKDEILEAGELPGHVAVIMDGNGRWAKKQGLARVYGHKEGVSTLKKIIEASKDIGLKYLTVYAFSIENWNRPKEEINALMELMVDAINRELDDLIRNGVRIRVIGNISDLPEQVQAKLNGAVERSASNSELNFVVALSYGSRWEIREATKRIAYDYKNGILKDIENISDDLLASYLTTAGIPDPDMLIRTSGECRLSNFLLWQSAYTELYFIDKFWPDFEKDDLYLAIRNFQKRERRFGMTEEQIKK